MDTETTAIGPHVVQFEGSTATWSGEGRVPEVGERVDVLINRIGAGTVVAHRAVGGYLAVIVKPDFNPDWRLKNLKALDLPEWTPVTAFGAEFKALSKGPSRPSRWVPSEWVIAQLIAQRPS